jgi:hypothetical protein
MDCGRCGAFIKYLKQQPETVPPGEVLARAAYTPAGPEASRMNTRPPPEGWQWVGHIRLADGLWRPVALASTLADCWDALLCHPLHGDLLCIPTQPVPRGKGAARDPVPDHLD